MAPHLCLQRKFPRALCDGVGPHSLTLCLPAPPVPRFVTMPLFM